jgi:hypothetical protein
MGYFGGKTHGEKDFGDNSDSISFAYGADFGNEGKGG